MAKIRNIGSHLLSFFFTSPYGVSASMARAWPITKTCARADTAKNGGVVFYFIFLRLTHNRQSVCFLFFFSFLFPFFSSARSIT